MNKLCKTCNYSHEDELKDLYCANDKSERCTYWVHETEVCGEWEEREVEIESYIKESASGREADTAEDGERIEYKPPVLSAN